MEKVRLGDVCEILDHKRVPITSSERIAGEYPYYGANGIQGYIADYIFDDELVLLAEDGGNFGSKDRPIAYRVSGKCWVNNHAHVLKPKDNIDVDYLCYSLMFYDTTGMVNGATRQKLTQSAMRQMTIPIVSISEQKEIVFKLNSLETLITKHKKQLEKLDELIKVRFAEMFGDPDLTPQKSEWVPIANIGLVVGGATPKTSKDEYWNGNLKWITPAELRTDTGYVYDSIKKITKKGAESCSLQLLPKNTVILTSRAPIGKVAIAGVELYCNQGFKNIICSEKIIPRYLYSLLLFNVKYLNSLGRGATFKEISKSIVENIKIPLPSIDLQNQFTVFVEQVDKAKLAVKKSLEKAEYLKSVLMQKYFE